MQTFDPIQYTRKTGGRCGKVSRFFKFIGGGGGLFSLFLYLSACLSSCAFRSSLRRSRLLLGGQLVDRLTGSGGLEVASLSREPRFRGSTPPLGTLGNVSENLFLGSTQAL